MKSVKISLITAIVSSLALNATPLEEAIKNVDISGSLRYRYDTFIEKKSKDYSDAQLHKFNASLTTSVNLGEGFKAVGTLHYNPDDEGDGGFGGVGANTQLPIYLEEAYLRYDSDEIYATSILLGRQRLNTIWTDNDNLGASVGMKAQLVNQALTGVTLTAFAIDSVNDDGDFAGANLGQNSAGEFADFDATKNSFIANKYDTLKDSLFSQNIYGAAVILDYAESAGVAAQAWFGYINDRMSMYAFDVAYNLDFADNASWNLQAQYLGNKALAYLKSNEFQTASDGFSNASLYTIATGVEFLGFDASVGYTSYGKKDKFSINVLEDMGDIITAGEEIQNLEDVSLHGSKGKNQIVFASAGYLINDLVRLGVDYAWGTTKFTGNSKKTNQEIVGRLEYHHSDKLSFSGFYSYLTQRPEVGQVEKHDNIRFEARYDF